MIPIHVPIQFRGPSDPGPFMGIITELAFHCWNMASNDGAGVHRLVRTTPLGKVDVMRVGDIVYVSTWGGGWSGIILSSGDNESYVITWTLSQSTVSINDKVAKIQLPATFFDETYVDPNYDMYVETCPFIFTIDHTSFIITIYGENIYQPVTKPRDDWHNNAYDDIADLDISQHFLTYYESFTSRPGEVHISFSQSPYTYSNPLSHIDRYIDQFKRLYIPVLGRGAEFEKRYPKYSKCEGYPYGKKPFTITENGVTTYREVVKMAGFVIAPPQIIMQLYWPFIPYMHEISYLNLQNFSGTIPLQASLQECGSFKSYELQYSYNEGVLTAVPLRTDVVNGSFPEDVTSASDISSFDVPNGVVSGTRTGASTRDSSNTHSVKKSATIGTVGDLKDLFVETELNGERSYASSGESTVTRVSNFPNIYYLPDFLPSYFDVYGAFLGCNYADQSTGYGQSNAQDSVIITGEQKLKCGDTVIDSGIISMIYSGESNSDITHDGSSSRTAQCPTYKAIHIVYTTQQMHVGEQQQLYALDIDGQGVAGVVWSKTAGGGSISSGGLYTAAVTNTNCVNNPTITASLIVAAGGCCEGFTSIDTLQIAVNAYGGAEQAGLEYCISSGAMDCPGACGAGHCCGGITGGRIYCDGSSTPTVPCFSGGNCEYHCSNPVEMAWLQNGINSCIAQFCPQHSVDYRTAYMKSSGCCPAQLL